MHKTFSDQKTLPKKIRFFVILQSFLFISMLYAAAPKLEAQNLEVQGANLQIFGVNAQQLIMRVGSDSIPQLEFQLVKMDGSNVHSIKPIYDDLQARSQLDALANEHITRLDTFYRLSELQLIKLRTAAALDIGHFLNERRHFCEELNGRLANRDDAKDNPKKIMAATFSLETAVNTFSARWYRDSIFGPMSYLYRIFYFLITESQRQEFHLSQTRQRLKINLDFLVNQVCSEFSTTTDQQRQLSAFAFEQMEKSILTNGQPDAAKFFLRIPREKLMDILDENIVDTVETAMDRPTALAASKNLEWVANLSTGQRSRVVSLWIDQLRLEREESEHKLYVLLAELPSGSLNAFLTEDQATAVKQFCSRKIEHDFADTWRLKVR